MAKKEEERLSDHVREALTNAGTAFDKKDQKEDQTKKDNEKTLKQMLNS